MDKQLVIEKANEIPKPNVILNTEIPMLNEDIWFNIFIGIFICGLVITLLLSIRGQKKGKKSSYDQIKQITPGMLGLLVPILILGIQDLRYNEYDEQVNTWKDDYVYPYLLEQPYIERDLVKILGEPDKWVRVEYQDDDRFTKTLPSNIHPTVRYDQPQGVAETVRFYELTEDLGHDMVPGDYGLTVHLTENEPE